MEANKDGIVLLKLIEKIMAIVMAERTLHIFFQHMGKSNDNYKSQFNDYVTVLYAYCGGVSVPQILVDTKLKELYL